MRNELWRAAHMRCGALVLFRWPSGAVCRLAAAVGGMSPATAATQAAAHRTTAAPRTTTTRTNQRAPRLEEGEREAAKGDKSIERERMIACLPQRKRSSGASTSAFCASIRLGA